MNFTETAFLPFIFVVFALWAACRNAERLRLSTLLTASLFAYGFHRWSLLVLLLAYCVVNWALGIRIAQSRRSRAVLTFGVCLNLASLAFWKYTPLLARTIQGLFQATSGAESAAAIDWLLPWGISFYSFTCIAYLVDIHRGDIPAEKNLYRFTLYITFFPHLVAGPILRGREFLDALQPGALPDRPTAVFEASMLIARGAFKKLVLANRIAAAIDPFFAHVADESTAGIWSLPFVYLYAFQIYFDFSGYTDMARGFGLLFGFRWPENFTAPYLAESVREFWQRWHITLSKFLRDYLFIPLGGSRGGAARTCANLLITMLLGGLWHGAKWSFLFWGGLHGAFLIAHRFWSTLPIARRLRDQTGPMRSVYRVFAVALTFHLVCLAWCFFRLDELSASLACVAKWVPSWDKPLLAGGAADWSLWSVLVGYGLVVGATARIGIELRDIDACSIEEAPMRSGLACGAIASLLLMAFALSPGGPMPAFIYFQF